MTRKHLPDPELEKLSKEHLVRAIREFCPFLGPHDLAWAVWKVEGERAKTVADAALEAVQVACERLSTARERKAPTEEVLALLGDYIAAHKSFDDAARDRDAVFAYWERWLQGGSNGNL